MTSIALQYRNLYFKKLATFAQIPGSCLVQKSSEIKVHNALGRQEKKKLKTTDINRDENFQKNSRVQPSGPQTE